MREKDNKIKNINLAFPCQEDWKSMTDFDKGKICEKCTSKVYDFVNKTDAEFNEIIKHSKTSVCGRFSTSQLNNTFLKYAASTLFTASGLLNPVFGQELIKTDSIQIAPNQILEEEETDVFIGIIVEQQPVPESGYEGFLNKIAKEIKLPEGLTQKGKVYVQFIVDTTGKMQDITIIKGLNELADKEVLRAIKAVDERFKPGRQRGKLVRTRMHIPITFDPEMGKKKKK
ncbi:TonB family protein [Rhodocytophaga rosea]|uniref:TonB family protein n=1 Tax=Rhodocytophaga rosea TaxID=2704465 RepID=A0A6C0GEU8_9BACT|nr:energy transducer TonB [Rhodocytophaga rosea]QHT66478.1 TonB family protein [Rhodocytophaga rosea]